MKNNLFTKVVAMLLCALLIIGYVPNVALAADSDWESDIDITAVGTKSNPEEIESLGGTCVVTNDNFYYYSYTAEGDGNIVVYLSSVPEGVTGDINVIVGENTYNLTKDGYDNYGQELSVDVSAGDEVLIQICADVDGAEITWVGSFNYPVGSKNNPVTIYSYQLDENSSYTATVPAGATYNFTAWYLGGTVMSINGGESVALNGMSYDFVIANDSDADAEYVITFTYPEGSFSNPAVAVLGDNVAAIEAGAGEYYFNYTAEKAGNLIVTISTESGNWQYTISNMTSYSYGDIQCSDSDPVVNPATIAVAEGDLIEIKVLTYDPDNQNIAPAGNVNMNLAYEPEGPVLDETLKFAQKALAFKEYIGVQFILTKAIASNYDEIYVESTHTTWKDGGTFEDVVETIIPKEFTTAYRFEKEVLAWSMSESFTITLYGVKDGVVYQGESFTTTVADMALAKIAEYNAANNEKACRTLVDMLNYGAAVQTGYNHNSDPANLPNANLGDYADMATADDPVFDAVNTNSGTGSVTVVANSVSMQSMVEIQFVFRGDITAYEFRYTVDGVTTVVPASEHTVTAFTKVPIGIAASNMRKVYTVALYDPETNEPVTAVYNVSIEAYAKASIEKGNYVDVCKALMKYGDSVASL